MPVFDARSNVYVAMYLAILKKNYRPIWGFLPPHPYFRTLYHYRLSVSCREFTPRSVKSPWSEQIQAKNTLRSLGVCRVEAKWGRSNYQSSKSRTRWRYPLLVQCPGKPSPIPLPTNLNAGCDSTAAVGVAIGRGRMVRESNRSNKQSLWDGIG